MIKHFNLNIVENENNKINKKCYLNLKYKGRDDKFIGEQLKRIEYNYDLNMKYFDFLDFEEFNKYLNNFVKKEKFVEVTDLSKYKGVSGIYILVLDKYKQVYIGISKTGITERIRKHWTKKKSSDRLIFGQAFNSVLSIDSFGALDTTRIFVKTDVNLYYSENKYVETFDNKYLLNRTIGGIGSAYTYTDDKLTALTAVAGNPKKRDFGNFIDERELYEKCNSYDIMMYESKKLKKLSKNSQKFHNCSKTTKNHKKRVK